MGVHFLDEAWAIMGHPRPVTVSGVGGAFFCLRGHGYLRPTPKKVWRQFDTDDFAGGVIRFEDGAGLQIEGFWASHQTGRDTDRTIRNRRGGSSESTDAVSHRPAGTGGRSVDFTASQRQC